MQTSEAPPTPVAGATMVAEAATAESALEEIHAAYGPTARIVEAKRVLRGGIGGFFAKEVVQIHAAAGEPAPTAAPPAPAPARTVAMAQSPAIAPAPAVPATHATASPIDRLLADADGEPDEVDFATFLRRQLTPEPAVAPASRATPMTWPSAADLGRPDWADAPAGATVAARPPAEPAAPVAVPVVPTGDPVAPVGESPAPPPTAPAAAVDASPADLDGRAWSRTTLLRLGLPVGFVQSLQVPERADDLAWTFALAEALKPLCRPLPVGRSLMVGPGARGLATSIGMPVTAVGQPLLALGDVAAGVTGSESSLGWMQRARRGRWLHLVAGGKGWRELLHADPLAISWAAEEHLPVALRAAVELGLVLGYGPLGGRPQRACPLDVALAIRDLVPVR